MIVVNFKTYKEASGEKAILLAKSINNVAKDTGVEIVNCPQTVDLEAVVKLGGQVWTQHVADKERDKSTGWLPAEVAKEAGATGTLLNHSEHKLSFDQLQNTVKECKDVGLKTLIFAGSVGELKKVLALKPEYVAYEPPELIASRQTSVAKSKPDIIEKAVKVAGGTPLIVGAGVKDAQDVKVSLSLGAKGIAVSSAVVLAKNPEEVITNLVRGFN